MRQIALHKYVLISLLFFIAFFYGDFGGQILAESSGEKGYNALFQAALVIFAIVYIYSYKIDMIFPYITILYSYFTLLFILSFFRNNIIEDLRLFTSIVLTQFIILFLSSLLHQLKFVDALYLLVVSFIIILWICAFVHLNSVGIISIAERNMYNRLGGLYFYGVTGIFSGLTALLSGIGFYIEKSFSRKILYGIFILNALIFTLGSDLRNAIFAIGICLVYLFYMLSKRSLYMKLIFGISIIVVSLLGSYFMANSESAGNMDDDLGTRKLIWAWSFDGISKKPITGYGKENYFSSNTESMIVSEQLSDPHSCLLNQAIRLGIPATLLFLYFYIKLSIYNYKYDRIFRGILIVIPVYWFLSTLTGGTFFIGNGNYNSYIFGLSIFGILLHPQLYLMRIPKIFKDNLQIAIYQNNKSYFIKKYRKFIAQNRFHQSNDI
jgi:hypothetical protein